MATARAAEIEPIEHVVEVDGVGKFIDCVGVFGEGGRFGVELNETLLYKTFGFLYYFIHVQYTVRTRVLWYSVYSVQYSVQCVQCTV